MAEEISPYFTSVVFWCHHDQFDTIALLLSPSPRLTTGSRTRSSLSTPASPESSSATCGPSLQQSWRTEEWLLLTPWVSKRPRSFCVSSGFSTSRHVCQVLPDFFCRYSSDTHRCPFLIYEMHLQPQKLVLVLVSFLIPLFFPVMYLWHCDSSCTFVLWEIKMSCELETSQFYICLKCEGGFEMHPFLCIQAFMM